MEDFGSDLGYKTDNFLPTRMAYSIGQLKGFINGDPSPVLIFYGGEPLLEKERMKEIMDTIEATYMLQTNGILLHTLGEGYIKRFESIVVSIDGDEETTDFFRGKGTYEKILENVEHIRQNGFTGEIVARMTVMEPVDIYAEVLHLLECGFDGVHWQLNALFWDDFARRPFEKWISESYNPNIKKLVDLWIERMRHGRVERIYPFCGIMQDLLSGSESLLRCGAGYAEYNIQTDGFITPCPVMQGMRDFYAGSIFDSHPLNLKKFLVSTPCPECHIYGICGGRCLYANVTKRWGEYGFSVVCKTVENLTEALREILPETRRLIEEGIILPSDFYYTRLNSCEIIP